MFVIGLFALIDKFLLLINVWADKEKPKLHIERNSFKIILYIEQTFARGYIQLTVFVKYPALKW